MHNATECTNILYSSRVCVCMCAHIQWNEKDKKRTTRQQSLCLHQTLFRSPRSPACNLGVFISTRAHKKHTHVCMLPFPLPAMVIYTYIHVCCLARGEVRAQWTAQVGPGWNSMFSFRWTTFRTDTLRLLNPTEKNASRTGRDQTGTHTYTPTQRFSGLARGYY